jgi:spermidine synthase
MSSTWKYKNWIAASWDRLSPGRHILLGVEQWIFREQSPHQEVAIARVPEFGRGLFLNGVVQFLELDEFIYHEHLAIPPLLFHPSPRRVLIQGGGDGLALREVLRDPRVEEVVLVDIDAVVIEACREHLPDLHKKSFDDPRAQIRVQDIVSFLSDAPGHFDVVLGDLLDVYDPAALSLYTEVLRRTRDVLAAGAIVCMFGELAQPSYRVTPLYVDLAKSFRHVEMHRATIDSFGGDYGFILASDEVSFREVPPAILRDCADNLRGSLQALVPEHFPSAFYLPPYLLKHLREALHSESYTPRSPKQAPTWIFPDNVS